MSSNLQKGPQFVRYFQPVINALLELGGSGRPEEVEDLIVEQLGLSDDVRNEQIPSGQSRFSNKVNWARFYLARAGLIDSSTRGVWNLTEKGRATKLNSEESVALFNSIHKQFTGDKKKSKADKQIEEDSNSPEEIDHRTSLMNTLLELPPNGFERLCQRLLRESGFEKVQITGKSGDGGLDGIGILQVNPFVSFKVLFQCKRYSGSVSASQVRDFRGAMMGRADKGIILTTGSFTPDARKESVRDGVPPIELVDGEKLLDMFEELELGLKPKKAFDIDLTFFDEFKN
ncbi:MAG: Mrr restriction system protein [Anaerolineales bacterium]|nr:Mrr restriction system protein [Anaerolineales bacterium]WKZ49345.1 MAG: restriction endonuclease [Anaerolineales bacterium]